VPPAANPLRREWGLMGRRVIGYSGNLGRAHDLAGVQRTKRSGVSATPVSSSSGRRSRAA